MVSRSIPLVALLAALLLTGCTRLVVGAASGALSGSGGVFASDDDPELVREAIPFGLKTIEGLLRAAPDDEDLLLAAASGFTQYAYAFVLEDADRLEPTDPDGAEALRERAKKLLLRAQRYGLRGLESEHDEFVALLETEPERALAAVDDEEEVPLLYWTAAAWALRISLSKDDMNLVGELPVVEAMMRRALAVDERFDGGAVHEFFVTYEGGRSEAMGGSVERAKAHLDRALELSGGKKVGVLLSWAENVSVARQDRAEFDALIERVLAFDVDTAPDHRLANLIAQERARRLKARVDDLFL